LHDFLIFSSFVGYTLLCNNLVSIKKERQLVGILKKYTLKKFFSNSKEKNKLEILQFLSNLKEKKNKIALNFHLDDQNNHQKV
jgi:hypothetical protein